MPGYVEFERLVQIQRKKREAFSLTPEQRSMLPDNGFSTFSFEVCLRLALDMLLP